MNNSNGDEVKKGCMGCLTIILGIPLIIYFCFSKTAEEAVRRVSLQDGIYTASLTIEDSDSDARKAKKARVEQLASLIEKNTGIDISVPIYKVLEKHEKVKDLSVKCLKQQGGEGLYVISYVVNGEKHQLEFIARDASLLKKELGGAEYIGDYADGLIRQIGPFYGIPPEGIRALGNLVAPRLPNN